MLKKVNNSINNQDINQIKIKLNPSNISQKLVSESKLDKILKK